ncbi:hypothetical protein [Endozoicomonas sp. Mp262]|uniref:hypothetical protein n=1 Tax=Endozoicomonas sp. Mp262 TaxID=2919499 RepID=UPI0021DA90A2
MLIGWFWNDLLFILCFFLSFVIQVNAFANDGDDCFFARWSEDAAYLVQNYIRENTSVDKTVMTEEIVRFIKKKKAVDMLRKDFEGGYSNSRKPDSGWHIFS